MSLVNHMTQQAQTLVRMRAWRNLEPVHTYLCNIVALHAQNSALRHTILLPHGALSALNAARLKMAQREQELLRLARAFRPVVNRPIRTARKRRR